MWYKVLSWARSIERSLRWNPEREYAKSNLCYCYAYDIAAVITARNTEEAQRKLRRVMLRAKTWLDFQGLDLAMHKMELLLITGSHIACGHEYWKLSN